MGRGWMAIAALLAVLPPVACAQEAELEEVVVTASRLEEPAAESPSSVTVIARRELEARELRTLYDALHEVPGLSVHRTGTFGREVSLYLRGTGPGHTLIFLDGFEACDPMSIDRHLDVTDLVVDDLERIEVVRGPQSTLWGSDAIGGVINLITRPGEGPPRARVRLEAGSFNSYREAADFEGRRGLLGWHLSAARTDSKGLCDHDDYFRTHLSWRFDLRPSPDLHVDVLGRYLNARARLDDWDLSTRRAIDDPNSQQNRVLWMGGLRVKHRLAPWWSYTLRASLFRSERDYRDKPNSPLDWDVSRSWYNGEMRKLDLQHALTPLRWLTLIVGGEYEEEEGSSSSWWAGSTSRFPRRTAYNAAGYLQARLSAGGLVVQAGFRTDRHNRFGVETTGRLAAAYTFERTGTRLRGSIGTGFKAPSLYQLYAPPFEFYGWVFPVGNPDLGPERSRGWDLGVDQQLFDGRLGLSLTFFRNDLTDLIEYDWSEGYHNVGGATTRGLEVVADARPREDLELRATYTYLHAIDQDTHRELARRPDDTASLEVNWRFRERWQLAASLLYVGPRLGIEEGEVEEAFTRVDLALRWRPRRRLLLYLRAENLLDESYQEVRSYESPDASFYGGLRVEFP